MSKNWAAGIISFKLGSGSNGTIMNLVNSDSGAIDVSWVGYARIVLVPVVLERDTTFQNLSYTYSATYDPAIGVEEIEPLEPPFAYHLWQNYPNPFSSTTRISYAIPSNTSVHLTIYDLTGRLVETLVDDRQEPGVYQVLWEGKDQTSGVYFYRLTVEGLDSSSPYITTKKMILLR